METYFWNIANNNNNNNNYIYRALNTGVSKRTGGLSNSVSFIYTYAYSYNNTIKSIYQSTDIHCSLQNEIKLNSEWVSVGKQIKGRFVISLA